jgi:hypothetical protein
VPLLLVTGFAVYGQIGYGLAHYSAPDAPFLLRLVIALGAALAIEGIALYVAWHAHDALLLGASATAARLRRASYAIALAVAGVNYAHFAGEGLAPTPGAIVFALFSAISPWLWGLHTRRAQRLQLLREGHVDSAGATFSAERWRAFPLRTWAARRWSIDHGVTDPREAWEGYREELELRRAAQAVVSDVEPETVELEELDDADPLGWWRTAPPVDEPDAQLDDSRDQASDEPDYRDESLPLEQRIDLAIAAELAAGATRPPGRRRLAALLGLPDPYPVRAVLEARSRNGHNQEVSA